MCLSRSPLQVGAVAHNRSDRGHASKPRPRATPTASQNAAGSHRYHLCHLRCRSPDSAAYLGTRAHGALPLCIRQLCSFDAPPLPRRPAGRAPMTPPVSALRPPPPRVSCRCWCSLCETTLVHALRRRVRHLASSGLAPLPCRKGSEDAVRVSASPAACSCRPLLVPPLSAARRSFPLYARRLSHFAVSAPFAIPCREGPEDAVRVSARPAASSWRAAAGSCSRRRLPVHSLSPLMFHLTPCFCARRAWLWRDAPPRLGSRVRSETGSVSRGRNPIV